MTNNRDMKKFLVTSLMLWKFESKCFHASKNYSINTLKLEVRTKLFKTICELELMTNHTYFIILSTKYPFSIPIYLHI